MSNPLEVLVVNNDEVVLQKLAAALQGRVGLEPDRDAVHLVSMDGGAKQRIVMALLGRLALSLLKPGTSARLLPREIAEMTGLPDGTVRPTLKSLLGGHVVTTDTTRTYTVPMALIDRAIRLVNDGSGEVAA